VSTSALIAVAWPVVGALAGTLAIVPLATATIAGTATYLIVLRYVFPSAFADLAIVAARLGVARVSRSGLFRAGPVADPTTPPA
jgi:hypothetical protein